MANTINKVDAMNWERDALDTMWEWSLPESEASDELWKDVAGFLVPVSVAKEIQEPQQKSDYERWYPHTYELLKQIEANLQNVKGNYGEGAVLGILAAV